ncbi:hypothetical protein [Brevibacillus sp. SKDU10]|uniref:hypothetical protein n=1 Tax=Brevibacillus sp. SKDU10 TaxID=1247872 RepID=UPI0012FCB612|nr:hypothetical protein [Brevibacillus sp. SKDU10]
MLLIKVTMQSTLYALGRELTESEKRTLAWLSERETETVANVQRIFDELSARVQK